MLKLVNGAPSRERPGPISRFSALSAVLASFDATTSRQRLENRTATRSIGRQSHFLENFRLEKSPISHKGLLQGNHEDFLANEESFPG